ncbi:PadR family transcriptional regulator [Corynebacterium terpenotabidum]|uniref:PadR DNA-binding transcription regulator n=1 Tax=Corynebacterium terpenotabidum Y-11 TaxID=1200352 RepID=S4XET4_9CORY|nr:PadR family transcriptional regulator [Corynebacterium terpenotabidum]AGP31074.1 PadR DNA-binding transcription regulator [Corynebacterium terpenotabidum Y-11]
MALDHAILISLAERPGTGYELGRQFSTSLGHFWPATRQQIYRTLTRLHTDGLVTCEDIPQQSRPDKKVYTLSDKGEVALASWIAEPSTVPALRDDLGVKLRGAEHGDLADILTDVRNHRSVHAERLALYRGYAVTQFPDATTPDSPALTGRRLHQYLVLRGGIRLEESFVAWCDEVLAALTPATEKSTDD